MKITSNGIKNGIIEDKFGKYGRKQKFGMPTLSLPLKIENAPEGTVSFAILFDDPDSLEVCNSIWIHWLVANLHRQELDEDESENSFDFIQGKNSWNDNCYGGPCPPDKPHKYRLKVYALSDNLNLTGNFTKSQFDKAIDGKVIDTAELFGTYRN